ncbi:hypothetical protein F5B17DRAFT_423795, partial [Nemania serpens]
MGILTGILTRTRNTRATRHDMEVVAKWPQNRDFLVIHQKVLQDYNPIRHPPSQELELSEETEPLLKEVGVKELNNLDYVPLPEYYEETNDQASIDKTPLESLQYLIRKQGSRSVNEYDIRVDVRIINPLLPPNYRPRLEICPDRISGSVETMDDIRSYTMRLFDLVGMERPFSEPYKDQLLAAIKQAIHGIGDPSDRVALMQCKCKLMLAQDIVEGSQIQKLIVYRPDSVWWGNVKYTIFEESHLVLKGISKGKLSTFWSLPYNDIGMGKKFRIRKG